MEDAAAIDDDPLPCPLCSYDLRATRAGRCPECGHAFDAADLRRRVAQQARLPWFVETETPQWWSGWATSFAALWPLRFWRQVMPDVRLRPERRLLFAVANLFVPSLLVPIAMDYWKDLLLRWTLYRWVDWSLWTTPLLLGGLLLLTVAISAVFQQTLRRAGIRSGHLWRVAVYGCDFRLLWLPALVVVMLLVTFAPLLFGGGIILGFRIDMATVLFAFITWMLATVRVVAAYLHYLRLPWAFVTGLLVQAVVGLAMFVGVVVLSNPPW